MDNATTNLVRTTAETFLNVMTHDFSDITESLFIKFNTTHLGISDGVWLVGLIAVVYGGFAFYALAPEVFHTKSERIPSTEEQKQHRLQAYDLWCVSINKAITVFFTYHAMQWGWCLGGWGALVAQDLVVIPVQLLALFVVYEFFYYWFHRAMHVPSVYNALHKHHHQQHAPFRGNVDAINTHPIEFVIGNYDHLLALHLVNMVVPVHVVTITLFIAIGGYFASLNHTRCNIKLHKWLFAVSAHDTHHRVDIRTNYGQYVMVWDVLFGTFKDSPDTYGETKKVA